MRRLARHGSPSHDAYLSTQGGSANHDGFRGTREDHIPTIPKSHICSRLAPPLLGGKKSTSEHQGVQRVLPPQVPSVK